MTSMNGSRIAASSGGRTALNTPTSAATRNAAPACSISAPGTIPTDTATAAAATTHPTTKRTTFSRGFSGFHDTASP